MEIYFEEIPEEYFSPDVSVTIHYKKANGLALAEEIAKLIRKKLDDSDYEGLF